MPLLAEFRAVRIMQACALCQRSLPLDEQTFDYCPKCGRLVCKERCSRTCPFCQVTRCLSCLEEIHGNRYIDSCENCSAASAERRKK